MNIPKILLLLLTIISSPLFSQQYDLVFKEDSDIDFNNLSYKTGNVYVFDYSITQNGKEYKLTKNSHSRGKITFELTSDFTKDGFLQKIHLIVIPSPADRTNKNQTEIVYLQEPFFDSYSGTGIIDNSKNLWIHPIRTGFFASLETAPFPYIKLPAKIGMEWTDKMSIGEGWSNELWGKWKGQLLLNYSYKIVRTEEINTKIGTIKCYVTESTAASRIGTTKLVSYYSKEYGFVRLDYHLLNNLKVKLWLIDFKTNKNFNDIQTFFKTKKYIEE